jgi:hypothetical protein
MRTPHRLLLLIAIALLAFAPMMQAQTTTGNISGTVSASGDLLPGVTIEAVHVPTGTHYDTVSGANGRYTIPNVRVGGPYRITAILEGFRSFEAKDVTVSLGETVEVNVNMQLSTVSEAITVTAAADDDHQSEPHRLVVGRLGRSDRDPADGQPPDPGLRTHESLLQHQPHR